MSNAIDTVENLKSNLFKLGEIYEELKELENHINDMNIPNVKKVRITNFGGVDLWVSFTTFEPFKFKDWLFENGFGGKVMIRNDDVSYPLDVCKELFGDYK